MGDESVKRMAASDIEWTDATWNPVAGCALVSPGCTTTGRLFEDRTWDEYPGMTG